MLRGYRAEGERVKLLPCRNQNANKAIRLISDAKKLIAGAAGLGGRGREIAGERIDLGHIDTGPDNGRVSPV
jgi:hypothetical protein